MFDGWSAAQNVDPLDLLDESPARYLNLVYYWAVKDAGSQQDVDKFDRQLWIPPKGAAIPKESPWSAESETAAFNTFAAQFTGSVVRSGQALD